MHLHFFFLAFAPVSDLPVFPEYVLGKSSLSVEPKQLG